jgi:hypothetical protein
MFTEKGKPTVFKLFLAIVRKFPDHLPLPSLHSGEVGDRFLPGKAKEFPLLSEVEHLGGIDQGFGRHAAAEDAKPAKLAATIDDRYLFAKFMGGSGGGVSRTSSAQNQKIEILKISIHRHLWKWSFSQSATPCS